MKDTTYLQHTSLIKFMAALGYETVGLNCCKGFKSTGKSPVMTNPKYLSLETCIALHNGNCYAISSGFVVVGNLKLKSDSLFLHAHAHKLVHTCYIQRKNKGFHLQKNQITLTEKGYKYVLEGKCGTLYQWLEELLILPVNK